MPDLSVARNGGLQLLTASGGKFARWWLSELREALPDRWLEWVNGKAADRVDLWRDGDCVGCRVVLENRDVETRIPASRFNAATLAGWLAERGLNREEVIVSPILSRELFFPRELNVPKLALGALPRILEQEILRRTPFQLSDVWHGATVPEHVTGEVVAISHWIIRKDRAEAALSELGLTSRDVDCLAIADADGRALPVIDFRAAGDSDPPWALRMVRLLAAAALGAVVIGFAVFEWSQASIAASLERDLAEARQGAQGGRDGLDPAARLFAMKGGVSALQIWDELSRILPDHTFLTETRMADGRVTLSGFSGDAARLVRIIDQSPLFAAATLASAITPDANEHKERFSISFRLRSVRATRASGRSGT